MAPAEHDIRRNPVNLSACNRSSDRARFEKEVPNPLDSRFSRSVGKRRFAPFFPAEVAPRARLANGSNLRRAPDLVLCNTDWQQRIMCERYRELPREKFVTLTNGFDDVTVPPNYNLSKHKPLLCLHLGGIYEGRRIDNFCADLSTLVKSKQSNQDAVKVVFVGDTEQSQITACRKVAGELLDSGLIEFRQRVDKEHAKGLLWMADLLLIFQGGYRAQIPLKFYEYLSTGKPIFAVSQQGALSELMTQMRAGIWTDEGDPFEIGKHFLASLSLPAHPADTIERCLAGRFHFRTLSNQLASWIRHLVDKRSV